MCGVPYCETEMVGDIGRLSCGHTYCVRCLLKTFRVSVDKNGPRFVSKCHMCRRNFPMPNNAAAALVDTVCPDRVTIMEVDDTPPYEAVVACRDCDCGECDGLALHIMPMMGGV